MEMASFYNQINKNKYVIKIKVNKMTNRLEYNSFCMIYREFI